MSFTSAKIIHYLSLILPFAHEITAIPKYSKLPFFSGFRECIDIELDTVQQERMLKRKMCTSKDKTIEIIIDLIAYTGILLLVSKNTLKYGYITGISTGLVMLFCSVTLARMYLGTIVSFVNNFVGIQNPYILLFVTIFVVSMYIVLASILEDITQKLTKNITIDSEAEKHTE